MRWLLLGMAIGLATRAYGQCGDPLYPYGHAVTPWIIYKGGALAERDSAGLYKGIYAYTDNQAGVVGDSNSYLLGRYHHGLPVGEWKDHCRNGSYSLGEYDGGGLEHSTDNTGKSVVRRESITHKKGVWRYFDRNGRLAATYRYEWQSSKAGYTDRTYRADSSSNFILVRLESMPNYTLWHRREVREYYSDSGIPISAYYSTIWRRAWYEYYETGAVKSKEKSKKLLGFRLRKNVKWHYAKDGSVTRVERARLRRRSLPRNVKFK